jgi:hypothetical protein
MLVCPMAAKEPRAMDAIAMKTTICCHSAKMPGKETITARTSMPIAAIFGAEAKKVVTGVGAPS